jgi:xanthine dehydrogenase YagS FAD-binding subunit
LLNDQGERRMHLADLYRLPADTPQHETILAPGDLITAVLLPANSAAPHSHYLKVRDLASFEWAPVSIAVALEMEDRRVCRARIVAGVEASAGRGGAVQGRPLTRTWQGKQATVLGQARRLVPATHSKFRCYSAVSAG